MAPAARKAILARIEAVKKDLNAVIDDLQAQYEVNQRVQDTLEEEIESLMQARDNISELF